MTELSVCKNSRSF